MHDATIRFKGRKYATGIRERKKTDLAKGCGAHFA